MQVLPTCLLSLWAATATAAAGTQERVVLPPKAPPIRRQRAVQRLWARPSTRAVACMMAWGLWLLDHTYMPTALSLTHAQTHCMMAWGLWLLDHTYMPTALSLTHAQTHCMMAWGLWLLDHTYTPTALSHRNTGISNELSALLTLCAWFSGDCFASAKLQDI